MITIRKIVFSVLVFLGLLVSVNGQDKQSSKFDRKKIEYFQTEKFITDSNSIVKFEARAAYPQEGRRVDLTTNYNHFTIDSLTNIDVYLPYFGRAYSADMNSAGGIKFSSTISNLKIEKDSIELNISLQFDARSPKDVYKFFFKIAYDGYTSLSVISNNKASITYFGIIEKEDREEYQRLKE